MLARYAVIGGGGSQDLARRIARKLGARYIGTGMVVFPDGEHKLTLSGIPAGGEIAVVVHSTSPPVDSNLVQILSLIHRARKHCPTTYAVVPYAGYARQDREFLPGEIVTAEVVAKLFRSAGASRIFVVDIHSMTALRQFRPRAENISAVPDLVRRLRGMGLKDPLVVSPDAGGAERAAQFADQLGSEFLALEKRRDRKTGQVRIVSEGVGVARGRDLVLVDDMISAGNSIARAAEFLKGIGAGRIFVACTHALLMGDAAKKIRGAGVARIISTNTIPNPTSEVDVSGSIARAIRGA